MIIPYLRNSYWKILVFEFIKMTSINFMKKYITETQNENKKMERLKGKLKGVMSP